MTHYILDNLFLKQIKSLLLKTFGYLLCLLGSGSRYNCMQSFFVYVVVVDVIKILVRYQLRIHCFYTTLCLNVTHYVQLSSRMQR